MMNRLQFVFATALTVTIGNLLNGGNCKVVNDAGRCCDGQQKQAECPPPATMTCQFTVNDMPYQSIRNANTNESGVLNSSLTIDPQAECGQILTTVCPDCSAGPIVDCPKRLQVLQESSTPCTG